MAVNTTGFNQSHASAPVSNNQSSYSFTHTTGGPRGALVFVWADNMYTGFVTSVTYGGVNLQLGYIDTKIAVWFKGSGLPATGNQTVVVNRVNEANRSWAVCYGFDTSPAVSNVSLYLNGPTIIPGEYTSANIVPIQYSDNRTSGSSVRLTAIHVTAISYDGTQWTIQNQDVLYRPAPGGPADGIVDLDNGTGDTDPIWATNQGTSGFGYQQLGWNYFDSPKNNPGINVVYLAVTEDLPVGFASPAFSNNILVNEQWMGSRSPLFP